MPHGEGRGISDYRTGAVSGPAGGLGGIWIPNHFRPVEEPVDRYRDNGRYAGRGISGKNHFGKPGSCAGDEAIVRRGGHDCGDIKHGTSGTKDPAYGMVPLRLSGRILRCGSIQ